MRDEDLDVRHPSTSIEVVRHEPGIATVDSPVPPLSAPLLATGLAVLAGLLGFGWYAGTRATTENTRAVIEAAPVEAGQALDEFDGDGPVGETGVSWSVLGPPFERRVGAAVVPAEPFGATSMLLLDTGWSDGTAGATLRSPAAGTGLVFRAHDVFNHWTVIAAPDFGTWNLVLTVDGEVTRVEPLGLTAVEPGTRVAVSLIGPTIRISIDGTPQLDLIDPTFEVATGVGVIGITGTGGAIDDVFAVADDPADQDDE